jgi:hypothetical protein
MKHKAILNLYPNAVNVSEENNVFEVTDANGNEISIDISTVETKATELQTAYDNETQAKIDAKVSGNQKLLDLGLTQAEATALTGYTPPVAE